MDRRTFAASAAALLTVGSVHGAAAQATPEASPVTAEEAEDLDLSNYA